MNTKIDDDEFNDRALKEFSRLITESKQRVAVGILGATNSRSDENSNASIGAKHEFGDPAEGLPIRSFLRMPISMKMQEYLEKAGAFTKDANERMIKETLKNKTLEPWLAKIGVVAETIVGDAFDTGGFGQWKPSNMAYKKNHQTLVETQQLRNSIVSDVRG